MAPRRVKAAFTHLKCLTRASPQLQVMSLSQGASGNPPPVSHTPLAVQEPHGGSSVPPNPQSGQFRGLQRSWMKKVREKRGAHIYSWDTRKPASNATGTGEPHRYRLMKEHSATPCTSLLTMHMPAPWLLRLSHWAVPKYRMTSTSTRATDSFRCTESHRDSHGLQANSRLSLRASALRQMW